MTIFEVADSKGEEKIANSPKPESDVGLIDQMVVLPFMPVGRSILYEVEPGKIRRYPAEIVSLDPTSAKDQTANRLIIGAKVPMPKDKMARHFTFAMIGDNARFSATPVRGWSMKKLKKNSKPISALSTGIEDLNREVKVVTASLNAVEDELKIVRVKASKIAGVDEIIDLEMELAGLKGYGEEASAESERLRALIEAGRDLQDTPDLDQQRNDLYGQLTQAAQVTSMADRLTKRRRETAQARLEDKLALIRETQAANPEALAKEALELRAKRHELEKKVEGAATGAAPSEGDF